MAYSPVFSAAFIEYTPDTPNLAFDVPDGFTAVIRQISVVQDIGAYNFDCAIANGPGAPYLTIDYAAGIGAFSLHAAQGRWVVPGGGSIIVGVTSLGVHPSIYVGGYLLTNSLP